MLFRNKQKELEAQLATYRAKAALCIKEFVASVKQYCITGDLDELRQHAGLVHQAEHEADNIRRDIEVMMYSRALFPESREDVLLLLETMDRVPNQAQWVVRCIANQLIVIPESLHPKLYEMLDVCARCVDAMMEAVDKLFVDFTSATLVVGRIDELESLTDRIESDLTRQIFSSELRDLDKILLRDLIENIAGITDQAEHVGDRVRVMVAKRIL